ncbi:signal transduction histidine kinase [Mycetocola sp. BIGb0189]|uniref:sensor histidine kinase n=1 Tax=Mycetocola sp. BIGb0189 TaxID=2940604 RepID=UPI002169FA85|nr:histidine kinase [Mycetocola sp. BIGb0189]MCS4276587.1 signal transduction histidine kinase [Mycetocola sp. BIGb0189]
MTIPPPPLPSADSSPRRRHTDAAVSRGRAFVRGLVTTIWVAVGIFFAVLPFGQHIGNEDRGIPPTSPGIALAAGIGALLMIGAAILLVWRTRYPYLVTAIAAGIALFLPSTPVPALIALVSVLHRRRGPWVWIMTGAVALACGVSTRWDAQSTSNSLMSTFAGRGASPDEVLATLPWAVPLSVFLLMLPFVATGLLLRARSERDVALVEVQDTRQSAATLSDEVSRQRERQEVAREIHDTLASRLSTLSLHAGALEVNARESDTALAGAASVVRESAQRSLDDLRYVVDVLRDPAQAQGSRIAAGRTSLADLPDLIEAAEALPGGIISNVFLSDAAGCDPRVAHACYRIVQEALANARRHAPGQTVSLSLRGGPGAGLTLTLTNPAPEGLTPTSVGGGHGVTGMTERAKLLGGTLTARTDDHGVFGIYAWLPWIPPEPAVPDLPAAAAP